MLKFEVPGDPAPWRAPKTVFRKNAGHAVAISDNKMKLYQQKVQSKAQEVMGDRSPITGPVALTLAFYFQMPKGMQRKRIPTPTQLKTTRPDLSNLIKSVEDAMSSVVYLDDSQVVEVLAYKHIAAQGKPGRLMVRVREVEP